MIEHAGKSFDDSALKPYEFTRRLVKSHLSDECEVFLVYGSPEGIGKSALVSHVLADVHGYFKCKDEDLVRAMWVKRKEALSMPKWESDWGMVEKFTNYPPDEVVDKCLYMLDNKIVEVAFHWDDAGTWLYLMDYHDPFVKAFMKYLPLARSNWKGGIILSTPFKEWVLKKLQTSEGILQVRITKPSGDNYHMIWKPRIATCYKKEKPYPGAIRSYWPRQFIDNFSAIMPDSFYKRYKPKRDKYALLAAQQMRTAIQKRKAKAWDTAKAEEHLEDMEKHIHNANYKAKELGEAIESFERSR